MHIKSMIHVTELLPKSVCVYLPNDEEFAKILVQGPRLIREKRENYASRKFATSGIW